MARRKVGNTDIETFDDEREYILHRPEIYIGSLAESITDIVTLMDGEIKIWRGVNLIPGLYKIINEVLDNAVDETIRTKKDSGKIDVTFNPDTNEYTVMDNGRGVPQALDKQSGKYTPELVFSTLRTGSNFDDESGAELIGKHGVGVSLTAIFSKRFKVETWDGKHQYVQEFNNNCREISKPKITKSVKKSGTKITFTPDYGFFKVENLNHDDETRLVYKRLKDFALTISTIKFTFNGKVVSEKSLRGYFKDDNSVYGESDHCKIGLIPSPFVNFHCIGYVNSAGTPSGTHVDYVMGKVTEHLRTYIKRKYKLDVKPAEIRSKFLLFISLWLPNPRFSSQTKEGLSTPVGQLSERIDKVLTGSFLQRLIKEKSIIESIVEIYQLKAEKKAKTAAKKRNKGKKIAKLIEAQSKDTENNILMICEGDSAWNEILNVRSPNVGGIPIRGKLLNVLEKKDLDVIKNEEIQTLMHCIGLEIGKPPTNIRYGKIGFLTDMDVDGNSIAGLLINFFYKYWPQLFDDGRMVRVLSPLYTAQKGNEIKRFYTKSDFLKSKLDKSWRVKYNKGLGSLGPAEYELVINKPEWIELENDSQTWGMIQLLYSSNADARKEWLAEVRE